MDKYHQINRKLLKGWSVIAIILTVTYFLEVLKGTRSFVYYGWFLFVTLVPLLISYEFYKKNPDRRELKYYVSLGYFIMYQFVLLTGNTPFVFTYIFPMLSLLIFYHDRTLIRNLGLCSLGVNLIMVIVGICNGEITLANSRDAEIRIALIVLVFAFSYMASGLYEEIETQNEKYTEEIDHKSRQLSEMAIQTITAIANTIDAKDTYTEGHSHRVAQYSRALARKLGKSEEEATIIYNIALLHDIGKIGVPDSILNKPGKLTDEEFSMIRQHPTIGGKILHDVKSFPDLEIGAKYHHERYDGRGYPEGLKGEDIPEIARIICVADSFDAMNSNRVYRKHFTKEYIHSELEHCAGTQFDPKAAAAMISLLEEGEIDWIDQRPDMPAPEITKESLHIDSDRRKELPPDVAKELEEVSNRIRDLLMESEEKDLLEAMGDAGTVQKFEKNVIESLKKEDGCLILMDIDNFAKLNHEYGYFCGDGCLRIIAEILLSDEPNEVCRYEGDSFLVYCPGLKDDEKIIAYIESLRTRMEAAFNEMENLSGVTLSFGAAVSEICGRRFARMLSCAETALSDAKKDGKAEIVIYHDFEDEERLASKKDLDTLSDMIEKEFRYQGALDIEYREFGRVYELVRNLGNRNAQMIQLVLFTILFNDSADMPISDRTMVMKYLESAINNTVRKVDVTARFSSTQRIVLFSNLPDDNVQLVIDRIMKEFYRMIPDNKFRLVYVSKNINLAMLKGEAELK